MSIRTATLAIAGLAFACLAAEAQAQDLWSRRISYQSKQDLFYNFYEGPNPSGVATAMYVSPRPVPPHVGHTYTTYQPFMPHEYLYRHTRTHYAYNCGAGWSRAKIRYRTYGLWADHWWWIAKGEHPEYFRPPLAAGVGIVVP
jgi:hypothetical protein